MGREIAPFVPRELGFLTQAAAAAALSLACPVSCVPPAAAGRTTACPGEESWAGGAGGAGARGRG